MGSRARRHPLGLRGWLSPAARRARSDDGFSVVEIVIAIAVFGIVAVFMSQEVAGGLRGVLSSKRRQIATQEANRVLEIARSLSYSAVGLAQSDATLATDSAIQTQNGKLSYRSGSTWEPLIWAVNPSGHPFNPHTVSVTRGSSRLTDYIYVTGVDPDGNGTLDLKRVTVRVTWDDTGSRGPANEVRAQTLINPNAITAGGGVLTARSFATGGSLTIDSSLLGLTAPLHLSLPQSTGTSLFRAVSSANCTAKSVALSALDLVSVPGDTVSVSADDDSRTATPSNPATQSKNGLLSIPAGPVGNLLGSLITSPVSCEANVNDLGHELGTGAAAGTVTAQSTVVGLGGLLNWLMTLASVGTLPVTQQIDHEIVAGQREAHAQAAASTGVVNVLKLPAAGIADGLVKIDALSYGSSVRASEGTPSAAPSVTSPTINFRIYDNGNKLAGCSSRSGGYCVLTVNPAAAGFTGVTYDVTHNFTQLLGLNIVNLSYTTHVAVLPPAKDPVAGVTGANGEKRWSAEYTPIQISAALNASVLGVPLIDADVDLTLGTVQSKACAGVTCT